MDNLPYLSSHFVNQRAEHEFVSSSIDKPKWTYEANKVFENALADNKLEFTCIFNRIAMLIPGKTIDEIKEHYQALVKDVEMIEAGTVPLPAYKDDPDAMLDLKGKWKSTQEKKRSVRWTKEEHEKFLMGLEKYGKGDWKSISRNCVVSKNPTQVASHAQKYYISLQKSIKPSRLF